MLFPQNVVSVLVVLSSLVGLALSAQVKDVFCHYLVGTVTPGSGHAELDIDQAMAMGFDGFALNIGAPTQSWSVSTVTQLFTHANAVGFKLFFSMDMSQDNNFADYTTALTDFLGSPSYYRGPNGFPFLSTFDSGGLSVADWAAFKQQFANQFFFVPDFDDTPNYYTNTQSWFSEWDSIVDGVFSWETAWPAQQTFPANTSTDSDQFVQLGSQPNGKAYMIGLSSLQYKHLPDSDTNYYRVGEVNLPERMAEILQLGKTAGTIAPDYVEVITWNDAGESHYIGNLWPEGIPQDELDYANQDGWPHSGWQPIITSFIQAYKAGGDATTMAPPAGSSGVGAMWYRTILVGATCSGDPLGKPGGWQAGLDAVNYAIVLPSNPAGMSIRISSNGNVLKTVTGVAGLNYGSVGGMVPGPQKVELLNSSGGVIHTAASVVDVTADTSGICNFNYQVAPLV